MLGSDDVRTLIEIEAEMRVNVSRRCGVENVTAPGI
jgi:hypothetical protein